MVALAMLVMVMVMHNPRGWLAQKREFGGGGSACEGVLVVRT